MRRIVKMVAVAAAVSLCAAEVFGVPPVDISVLAVEPDSITVAIGGNICTIDTEIPDPESITSPSLRDFFRNIFVAQQASCPSRRVYTEACIHDGTDVCLYAIDCDMTCSGPYCDRCSLDCDYWRLGCSACAT